MKKQEFEQLLDDLYNVKRLPINNDIHWDGGINLSNGYAFFGSQVRSQYLGRISQPIGIKLGNIINKLKERDPQTDPNTGKTIYPHFLLDDLIRLHELEREEGSLFGYFDEKSKRMYGIVSDQHTYIPDRVVYNVVTKFLDHLGEDYNIRYDHNIYRMRLQIDFPDLATEIGRNDVMNYSVWVTNSGFGHGVLGYRGGFYRLVCSNGLMIGEIDASYIANHKLKSDKLMLTNLTGALVESFGTYEQYRDLVIEASEIAELYIREETSLEKWLPDNFDIKVREAREVFKIMKTNEFPNTAFWIGQGVAEAGRNMMLDDRERLEIIAGELMLAQVV